MIFIMELILFILVSVLISIRYAAAASCPTTAGELVISEITTSLSYQAYYNCPLITSVTIPSTITSLGTII